MNITSCLRSHLLDFTLCKWRANDEIFNSRCKDKWVFMIAGGKYCGSKSQHVYHTSFPSADSSQLTLNGRICRTCFVPITPLTCMCSSICQYYCVMIPGGCQLSIKMSCFSEGIGAQIAAQYVEMGTRVTDRDRQSHCCGVLCYDAQDAG